jgi:hypothetical protein
MDIDSNNEPTDLPNLEEVIVNLVPNFTNQAQLVRNDFMICCSQLRMYFFLNPNLEPQMENNGAHNVQEVLLKFILLNHQTLLKYCLMKMKCRWTF